MKIQKLIPILSLLTLTVGCSPSATTTPSTTTTTTPTDGSQSAAQLAGSGSFCSTDTGIDGGSKGYVRLLTLGADGTYSYNVYLSDHVGCSTAQNSGGNNIATFTESGTYSVGGTGTTPSTSTKVTFTVATASMVTRGATYNANATAQAVITWLNACTSSPGFSTSADNTRSLAGIVCGSSGSYNAVTFPAAGATYTNIFYNTGSATLSAGVSGSQLLWSPGGSTFPSSYTQTYLTWQ